MNGIDRRGFIAASAATPLVAGLGAAPLAARSGTGDGCGALLLHDASLESGRRFAARAARNGIVAVALDGDRVRQVRAMLRDRPHAIWGLSRFADEILVHDVARAAGYERIASIRHGDRGGVIARCRPDAAAVHTLVLAAGRGWPEAFADMALGAVASSPVYRVGSPLSTGMSWVLVRTA